MSAQTLQPEAAPLTATDRCDRCGAQAYMRVTLLEGELFFCAHHAREHKAALVAGEGTILHVHDETGKLSS